MGKKERQERRERQAQPAGQTGPSAPGADYVRKSTMVVVVLIAFLAGGFVGSAVTVSMRQDGQAQTQQGSQQAAGASAQDLQRILSLEQQVKSDPTNLAAWIDLGNVYFDTDQPAKSVAAYQKALALDPSNGNVWTDMGVMYRRLEQPKKAVESFDKAIAAQPGHETARFNKGVVLLHDLNDMAGAVAAWEDLLRVNPSAQSPSGQPVAEMVAHFRSELANQAPAPQPAPAAPAPAASAPAAQPAPAQPDGKPGLYMGN